jgi:hypothetical protein
MCYISIKRIKLENNTSENSNLTIEQRAISLLETYQGANNYILKLKYQKETNKRFFPTRAQCDYIISYYEVIPKVAKRWVDLDPYFAKKIADEKLLIKIPEQIWVEKLLVEKEKSYHVWGKILEGETIHEFWLPKGALIKTHTIKNIVVDYSKYSNRPPLDHQKEAIEKLAGSKRFILADDMGLGKSLSAVVASLEVNKRRILVVCPATLKINWKREFEFFTNKTISISDGKTFSDDSDIVIVNYDILKNFHDPKNPKESKILNNFDLIIADECFTYETMVMTDIGEIKIGDIVENSLDVNVLTYNHQTKKTEYKKIFRWLKKNKDTIYQIKLQNGVFIECTGNHKFYTKNKGYVRADELTTNDDLCELSKGINQKTNLEKKSNLFSILCNKLQIQNKSTNKKNKRIQIFQKLSKLWKNNVILHGERNEQPKKLFNKMYGTNESKKSGNQEKTSRDDKKYGLEQNNEKRSQKESKYGKTIFRKNEEKQPNVKFRKYRKNETEINWKNFSIKRWEWKNNSTTRTFVRSIRRRLDYGITYFNKRICWKTKIFTKLLQSRYWKSDLKIINRDRWKNTHDQKMEIFGQEENRDINIIRVENIKILERGSYDKSNGLYSKNTRVYDLEIEGNHNYFVNGVLVWRSG